jgi:hypothetical protein
MTRREWSDVLAAGKLLGEIELPLPRAATDQVEAGEVVLVRRTETGNIRVENGRGRPLGPLPGRVRRWLAPLLKDGVVWLEAYVKDAPRRTRRLLASVYLHRSRLDVLAERFAVAPAQLAHQLVLRAYRQLPRREDAREVRELHARLTRRLRGRRLLPETELLLALFPRVGDELDAARRLRALGRLNELLFALEIGPPRQERGLTAFPLFAPTRAAWPPRESRHAATVLDAPRSSEAASGVLLLRGTELAAVELRDSPRGLRTRWRRLLNGADAPLAGPDAARRLLDSVVGRLRPAPSAAGPDDYFRLDDAHARGGALMREGRLRRLFARARAGS